MTPLRAIGRPEKNPGKLSRMMTRLYPLSEFPAALTIQCGIVVAQHLLCYGAKLGRSASRIEPALVAGSIWVLGHCERQLEWDDLSHRGNW